MATTTAPRDDDRDRGLAFDMSTLMARRRVLGVLGAAGAATLVAACSSTDGGSAGTSATAPAGSSCSPIPEETAGPFPADGSNGVDVLGESGVVRGDIRSSFGSSTTTAAGVPLTVELTVTDTAAGCVPLAGAAVYVWHCDRDGNYSMYSEAAANENYLRGVQETDADGRVTFTTIFPACYPGRWPHIHFEIYPSVAATTDAGNVVATSQLALPAEACEVVFASDGYEQSLVYLAETSLDSDGVFRDGSAQQIATTVGTVIEGYVATLSVAT